MVAIETTNESELYFNVTNDQLFSINEIKKTMSYYQPLMKSNPFELKLIEGKGKGLVATRLIKKDEIFLKEYALVGMQSSRNKPAAHVCSECHYFLGDIKYQIKRILKRELTAEEDSIISEHNDKFTEMFRSEVKCDCGDSYCCHDCKENAWNNHHKLLCKSARPQISQALEIFNNHAETSNEIFKLAAKIYAKICLDIMDRKMTLEDALVPYRMFTKRFWWDVIEPESEHEPEHYEIVLKAVLMESLELLNPILPFDEIESILSLRFYSLLIGMFELNNVNTVVSHPVAEVFQILPEYLQGEIAKNLIECLSEGLEDEHDCESCDGHEPDHAHGNGSSSSANIASSSDEIENEEEQWEDEDEDDEDEDENPAEILSELLICEGMGLHAIHALINHSCIPNARVYKDELCFDSKTMIIALQDIQEGEEILVSYLDDGDVDEEEFENEKEDRAQALREYGIQKCACDKCFN